MVKMIGVLLIISSFLALAAGAFIDLKHGDYPQVTGNVISNLITQLDINLGFLDYLEGIAFSYSIFSLIMGVIFLVRV